MASGLGGEAVPQPDFRHGTDDEIRAWIEQLVDDQVMEGHTLDYKKLVEPTPKARLDLARDIVAFANTAGGTVLVGVDENRTGNRPGVPVRPIGMTSQPGFAQRLHDVIADAVRPRLTGLVIKEIAVGDRIDEDDSLVVYVCHVDESVAGPHMVQKDDGFQFVHRTQLRVDPMTEQMVSQQYAARFHSDRVRAAILDGNDVKLLETLRLQNLPVRFAAIPMVSIGGRVPIDESRHIDTLSELSKSLFGKRTPWQYTYFGAQTPLSVVPEQANKFCRYYDSASIMFWSRIGEHFTQDAIPKRMIDLSELIQIFAEFARFVVSSSRELNGPKNYTFQLLLRTYRQSAWVRLQRKNGSFETQEVSVSALPSYPDQFGAVCDFEALLDSENAVEEIVREGMNKLGRYLGENEFGSRLSSRDGELILDLGGALRVL